MKKYVIRVWETFGHEYEIEAETEDAALEVYHSYDKTQRKELDLDGFGEWGSPWTIEEKEEEDD